MKKTVFATVNGKEITGEHILRAKKRILIDHEDKDSFVYKESEDNNAYLNSESLQKLIEIQALSALAKFEGYEVDEDEISRIIYELKTEYTDEFEWESNLDMLGLDDSNLREDIKNDLLIDMLIQSRIESLDSIDEDSARNFYHENIQFMKHPSVFTFLEIEVPSQDKLQEAAVLLSGHDTAAIMQNAPHYNLQACLNEEIPLNKLPEPLQDMLPDLEENKIGSLPTEDGEIVLIKLLKKYDEKVIPEEEAVPGLIEYLKADEEARVLDALIEDSLEKCEIVYSNADLLKTLS